jgi:hypothetical protein
MTSFKWGLVAVALLLYLPSPTPDAAIHKCLENGETTYQDVPCLSTKGVTLQSASDSPDTAARIPDYSNGIDLGASIISVFLWFIPLILLVAFFKSPFFKGKVGEFAVSLTNRLRLDRSVYHTLDNITLPDGDGTTQIDHIIVSRHGLFVIETKNMKGWIFGGETDSVWTQKIYRHTNRFQNPLRQNYKHVKTLQGLLGLRGEQIFSIVTFVGESEFKTKMPANVTQGGGYVRYIKSKTGILLSEREVSEIVAKIRSDMLPQSMRTDRQHVRNVKRRLKN